MTTRVRLLLAVAGLVGLAGLAGCTVGVGAGTGHVRGSWVWGHPGYRLVAIGDTGIQYVADVDDDIFFHTGLWHRWYGGGWYSCHSYGGTWVRIAEPPVVFLNIPPAHVKYRAVRAHVERRAPGPGPVPGKGPEHPGKGPGPHGKAKGHEK